MMQKYNKSRLFLVWCKHQGNLEPELPNQCKSQKKLVSVDFLKALKVYLDVVC